MTCKHRYEPYDIGFKEQRLENYHYWRCIRCADIIFSKLKEKNT